MSHEKAIDTLAESIISAAERISSKAKYDMTATGVVRSIPTNDTKYYTVLSSGVEYKAFSSTASTYNVGDNVIVLFPSGQNHNVYINGLANKNVEASSDSSLLPRVEALEEGKANTVHNHVASDITNIYATLLNTIYPIGSIYTSTANTSPQTVFSFLGITSVWERITNTFLYAANDSDVGTTGGSSTVTLTTGNLPAHTHGSESLTGSFVISSMNNPAESPILSTDGIVSLGAKTGSTHQRLLSSNVEQYKYQVNIDATHEHESVGNSEAVNIMPPYLAVYMWRRVS